jgi:anti-sigma factor RsiW
MTGCADKILLLNALVDDELDAANTAALESHIATCPACEAALAELQALRRRIAGDASLRLPAPPALRQRIEAKLPRPRQWGWAGGAAGGALAASLAFALIAPGMSDRASEDELIAGHVRGLLPGRLIDIATSDRHVVKPWFNGRIDFAPPVVDLAPDGFPLVGGRLDYLDGRSAAVLVYRGERHIISLTIAPARRRWLQSDTLSDRRDGYTIRRWRQGDLDYWAISDIDPATLDKFCAAFAHATQP